jgi:hypothetical protein
MTNILYTYNIQIHNKAAIFLINIDTLFFFHTSYFIKLVGLLSICNSQLYKKKKEKNKKKEYLCLSEKLQLYYEFVYYMYKEYLS